MAAHDVDTLAAEVAALLTSAGWDVTAPPAPVGVGEGEDAALAFGRLVLRQLAAGQRASALWHLRHERVRAVLEERAVALVFQPIIDLHGEAVVGYEALSRFASRPRRTPDKWFAEAAVVGLAVDLEVLAIEKAVEALPLLPEGQYLSVNVSPPVATSPRLVAALSDAPLHRVVLEITEHEAVTDYAVLNASLQPLRRRGLRVAVDDAGSGFASFRHVVKLQPDIVKLDTTLVHEIDCDRVLRALGYSLTAFASALGAVVIAEGVETDREVDALRFLGVPYAQGYHFGRPGALPETPAAVASLAG
ncbi:MAG: EAL domain-containing protein [Actinomycetota bacterium]|nr:EAL domain-containing protein [Actinomycetota bacterium]